jgi:hypothetical protein
MQLTILLFTFFTALGLAFDKLVPPGRKIRLHDRMVQWWFKIGSLVIPDFKTFVISKFLNAIKFITKYKIFSWPFFLWTVFISWLFTSLGSILEVLFNKEPIDLPFYPLYLANYPFDFIAILLVIKTSRLILNEQNFIKLFLIILAHLSVTYLFAGLCIVSAERIGFSFSRYGQDSGVFQSWNMTEDIKNRYKAILHDSLKNDGFSDSVKLEFRYTDETPILTEIKYSLVAIKKALLFQQNPQFKISATALIRATEDKRTKIYPVPSSVLIPKGNVVGALSTFTPTLILLLVILFSVVVKSIFAIARFVSTTLLDLITQNAITGERRIFLPENFLPGTVTGALLGVISAFILLIAYLINMYHHISPEHPLPPGTF